MIKVDFFEYSFFVNEKVFYPRFETEILVEIAIEYLKEILKRKQKIFCVDVGTGTGCIIISIERKIKELFPNSQNVFIGIDIDPEVLKLAKLNKEINRTDTKFIRGDILSPVKYADIIVSNPPYVSFKLKDRLDVSDPPHSIFGGEYGYEFTKELIIQSAKILPQGGLLIFETGYDDLKFYGLEELGKIYKNEIIKTAENSGFEIISFIKDYNKIERIIVMRKRN